MVIKVPVYIEITGAKLTTSEAEDFLEVLRPRIEKYFLQAFGADIRETSFNEKKFSVKALKREEIIERLKDKNPKDGILPSPNRISDEEFFNPTKKK